jgi:hypothetical protein|nr:MAG TPA_asm: Exonuclease [Caudoviricetes sp.]
MHIIDISQSQDTDAWLRQRIGKITGTKAGALSMEHYAQKDVAKIEAMAEKAKTDAKRIEYLHKAEQARVDNQRLKVPAEFWSFLAEMWADPADGEPPMARGHRLENENIRQACEKLGIDTATVEFDTGMWVRDDDERIAISPDAHEKAEQPTFAFEAKSLGTRNHLMAVVPYGLWHDLHSGDSTVGYTDAVHDMLLALFPDVLRADLTAFDFVPDTYKAQVLQYFAVNDSLETVYFTMLDDRVYGNLSHVVMPVRREDVQDKVEKQLESERNTLAYTDMLSNEFFVNSFAGETEEW